MPSRGLVLAAVLALAEHASGFKFMANFKTPSVGSALKSMEAAEKFGDKSEPPHRASPGSVCRPTRSPAGFGRSLEDLLPHAILAPPPNSRSTAARPWSCTSFGDVGSRGGANLPWCGVHA